MLPGGQIGAQGCFPSILKTSPGVSGTWLGEETVLGDSSRQEVMALLGELLRSLVWLKY